MRSFTVGAVLGLLVCVATGARLDVVDTLRGGAAAINDVKRCCITSGELGGPVQWPELGKVKVAGKYFLTIGDEDKDVKGSKAAYVCGTVHERDAAVVRFTEQSYDGSGSYTLQTIYTPLSNEARDMFIGAFNWQDEDSFGDAEHSLRVAGLGKESGWQVIWRPVTHESQTLMQIEYNRDPDSFYTADWYLTISDSPKAKRDSSSMYLSVTDDIKKAVPVEVESLFA